MTNRMFLPARYVRWISTIGGKRLAGELFEAAQLVTSPLVARQIAQVYALLESGSAGEDLVSERATR